MKSNHPTFEQNITDKNSVNQTTNNISNKRDTLKVNGFNKISSKDIHNNSLYEYAATGNNNSISQAKTILATKISQASGIKVSPYEIEIYRSETDAKTNKTRSDTAPQKGEKIIIGLFKKNTITKEKENTTKSSDKATVYHDENRNRKLKITVNNTKVFDGDVDGKHTSYQKINNYYAILEYNNGFRYRGSFDHIPIVINAQTGKKTEGKFYIQGNYIFGQSGDKLLLINTKTNTIESIQMTKIVRIQNKHYFFNKNESYTLDNNGKFVKQNIIFNKDNNLNKEIEYDFNTMFKKIGTDTWSYNGRNFSFNDIKEILYIGEGGYTYILLKDGSSVRNNREIDNEEDRLIKQSIMKNNVYTGHEIIEIKGRKAIYDENIIFLD